MLLQAIRSSGSTIGSGSCLRASPLSQARSRLLISRLRGASFPRSQALDKRQSLSTQPPPPTSKSDAPLDLLNIRQRKPTSWVPRWQTLTLSRDNPSDPGSLRSSINDHRSKPIPDEEEEMDVTKYLLSPQNALAVFLPKGYPESVTPNYWAFAKWQFAHNVTGSVSAVISTQSLLFAMGLGAGSIPMAAALNWIIKDGLGQLGGVVYASFVSDKFDSEPKRFRFQATVAMQGANILELLAPLWPGSFLLIASISNIGKNMAWLASSATRAQMNKTFTLRDNLGDVTGKSGSQTTAAGLVGTGLGVIIAAMMNYITKDPTVLPLIPMCVTFMPFAVFNIYSNYKSSYYVTTSSLNVPRAETVFNNILRSPAMKKEALDKGQLSIDDRRQLLDQLVLTPKTVAHGEVFVRPYRSSFTIDIDIEPTVSKFAGQGDGAKALDRTFRQLDFVQPERYYIMADESGTRGKDKVVLWFDKQAKGSDLIQGFYHACAVRLALEQKEGGNTIISKTHEQAIETVPQLVELMSQKGWDTESLFLTDGDHNRVQLH
ncbi:vitamin B6 photo-protection and homoeostasis-domain-containing protein [Mortierella sp. GBAus27b]|nr:vitamin B6 photo-protection and homoeostasis-domain-containing protein [Mortierella sp. GBAus27b]